MICIGCVCGVRVCVVVSIVLCFVAVFGGFIYDSVAKWLIMDGWPV